MRIGRHIEVGIPRWMSWREYAAMPVLRVGRFSVLLCSTWFPGYQIVREYLPIGRKGLDVMLFVIPCIALRVQI